MLYSAYMVSIAVNAATSYVVEQRFAGGGRKKKSLGKFWRSLFFGWAEKSGAVFAGAPVGGSWQPAK